MATFKTQEWATNKGGRVVAHMESSCTTVTIFASDGSVYYPANNIVEWPVVEGDELVYTAVNSNGANGLVRKQWRIKLSTRPTITFG